jgi:hypothetical protein
MDLVLIDLKFGETARDSRAVSPCTFCHRLAIAETARESGSRGPGHDSSQGDFRCPLGQSLFLQSVTYSGTFVSDATGNTFHATPDPISSDPIHILIG